VRRGPGPGGPGTARVGSAVALVLGWALARAARAALAAVPPGGAARWRRTNHRGEPVTLLAGPTAVAGAAGALLLTPGLSPRLRAAAVLAAAGAGGFGVLDDLAERGDGKGLRGHLGALRRGRLTTGGVKLLGIGAAGVASAALARGPAPAPGGTRAGRAAGLLLDGALVAGSANLLNLFDLRPGRALKVGLLVAPAAAGTATGARPAAVTTGVALALLPDDLAERAMLGDGGANALGAVLGLAALGARPRTRRAVLAAVVALTLASEKVSFTRVIAATPGLRDLDALGRRPAAP